MQIKSPSLKRLVKPLVIPKAIDIERILRENPPTERQINQDCLLYLISLIYSKSMFDKKQHSNKDLGFIPLKMEYLNRKFYASRANLNYLINLGILESDNKYSPNYYSIGYRINSIYLNGETKYQFFKRRMYYYKIDKIHPLDSNLPIPPYLSKAFIEKRISLNLKDANKILDSYYQNEIDLINKDRTLSESEKNNRLCDMNYALNFQKEKVSRICNNDYSGAYFIDKTSFRFHSLITTLKKEVRPLIKLNGQNTVGIDLKNSQPFFLLLLLKRAFYSTRNRERKILRMLELDKNNRDYRDYILNNNINPLMIWKIAESIENTGSSVYEFCHAIRNGTLYELFMSKFYDLDTLQPEQYKSLRNNIKEQFLIFLYDEPERSCTKKSVKSIIQREYPEIYEFIGFLKRFKNNELTKVKHTYLRARNGSKKLIEVDSGFKRLSTLIQRLESKVILDIVCREIARKHPEMPFLTVHDSIIVPQKYTKAVLRIMNSEIERVTWEIPQIKLEM